MHGIAFNATILTLRADTAGSCTTPAAGETEANCSFNDSAIAAGVNRAISAGARVINISLGGAGGASASLRSAVQRATAAGIIIVVSAGNEYNDVAPKYDINNPSPFAQALLANGNGLVIISTSVDDKNVISNFSNRAGASQNSVLSALGDAVCCVYENDSLKITVRDGSNFVSLYAGTSFSAPQISGAAALLAQAFPNLTGQQIVNLLLSSARDAGDVGTDATYGRGILDIGRAFAPTGTTSLAGSNILVPLGGNGGTTSGPMGDAAGKAAPVEAIILDSYGRAYQINLADGLSARSPQLRLTPALVSQGRSVSASAGSTELAFAISGTASGGASVAPLSLTGRQEQSARVLAGRITANIAKDTRFSLGIRQAAAGQILVLQKMGDGAFLTATNARLESGFERRPLSALAIRKELAGLGITGSAETGAAQLYEQAGDEFARSGYHNYRYSGLGLALDKQIGPARLALGANWLGEDQTILGARFAQSLTRGGAQSLFVDASGELALGGGWSAAANWRQGWTRANAATTVAGGSVLTSNAFSFDVTKRGLLANNDQLALRISQPLRVTGGGLSLRLPVAYDYATLSPTYGIRQINLTPAGREIASELAWMIPIDGGSLSTNLFWRQDPGHFANTPDDVGAAFRLQLAF
jgi:hypothetical protein